MLKPMVQWGAESRILRYCSCADRGEASAAPPAAVKGDSGVGSRWLVGGVCRGDARALGGSGGVERGTCPWCCPCC